MLVPFVETCDRLAIKVVELRIVEMRFIVIYVTRPGTIYRNINIK